MSLPEDKPCPTLPSLKQFKRYTNCRHELVSGGFEEGDNCGKCLDGVLKDDESNMTMGISNKPNVCDNEDIELSFPQETCHCHDTVLDSDSEDHGNNPGNGNDNKPNEVEGDSLSQVEEKLKEEAEVKHRKNIPTSQFRLKNDEENVVLENNKIKGEIMPKCAFVSYPLPRDKRKDIWLCIPGELKQMRKVNFEPASAFEVDKMKEQLLCRPAQGLGQNWFQLNIGNRTRCFEDIYFVGNSIPYQMDDVKVKQTDNKKIFKFDVSDSNGSWLLKNLPPHSGFLSLVEIECNNSNGIQHGSTSSQNQGESLTGRVIRVEGDGRCLFRSLVTCLSSDLQKARRDDFGCAMRRDDSDYETCMADVLRAKVVNLMKDNAHFYGQLERVVINADQPMPPGYTHFLERLHDMTLTSTMPGDLELNAVSTVLEKQVLVVDTNLRPVVVYGKERYPQSKIVTVRFTRLGPDVGHYDAVILDRVYDFGPITKRNDAKGGHEAVSQTSVMDYFTDLISKFKITPDDNKDVSMADFGVQCPSEKDLSHISEPNLICSKNSSSVPGKNESSHFFLNDKNMNKCQNSTSTESDNEKGQLESDGEAGNDDVRIDEWNDDSVFYVTKGPDLDFDLIKDTDLFYVTENGANTINRNGSRNFDSGEHKKEQLLRAPIIKNIYEKKTTTSKEGKNNRKRKLKTGRQEEPRAKKRKTSFKPRKICRRCSSLSRRVNGRHNRNKTRRSQDARRVKAKSYRRLGAKSYRRLGAKRSRTRRTNTYKETVARRQHSADHKITKKGHTLPKYFSEMSQQNPSSLNQSGCRTCFMCCKPITMTSHGVSVCILCGRAAHSECVDPSRKEDGGVYSLCCYCVP